VKLASDVSSLVLIKDNAEFLQMCVSALERKEARLKVKIDAFLLEHVAAKMTRMFKHNEKFLVKIRLRKKQPVEFSRTHYINAIKVAHENKLIRNIGGIWDVYEWADDATRPTWWTDKDNNAVMHIKSIKRQGSMWWDQVRDIRDIASRAEVIYCDSDLFHFILDWSGRNVS
jgi:hypothetical protein